MRRALYTLKQRVTIYCHRLQYVYICYMLKHTAVKKKNIMVWQQRPIHTALLHSIHYLHYTTNRKRTLSLFVPVYGSILD